MKKFLIFSVFILYTFFSGISAQILNPDSKYPVPNNYGDKIYEGVNLFSGSLNFEIQLEEISGQALIYPVKAFYNSRTPALIKDGKVTRVDNELGGYGWKLMDYYKIYHDQANSKYYFVDGQGQYPLIFKEQLQNQSVYKMGGKYFLWQISIGSGYAAATSEDGTKYYFQPSASPNTGMNLWMIVNENKTDTLTFRYNRDNNISSIKNIFDDSLYFHYSGNHLDYIAHYTNLANGQQASPDLVQLSYSDPDQILTFISFLKDVNLNDGLQEYTVDNMGWSFSYYASGFTKFLEILKSPTGKETVYTYKQLTIDNYNYDVVLKTRDYNGSNTHDNSFIYTIENAKKSPDSVYTFFNTVNVFPGTKSDTALTAQYFTSFETANATDDPLIAQGNGVMGTTSYKHSGSRSLDFNYNNQSAYASSRTLVSEKLALIQNGDVAPDSVNVSYYWYGQYTQQQGNNYYVGAVVNVKLRFYNSEGDEIEGNFYKETGYDLKDYGNRWNQFTYSVAAPVNAKKVRFEITETPGKGFYFIDDLTLSGAIAPPNGKIIYNFFNGKEVLSLNGVPSDYYSEIINENTLLEYFSGFESSQPEDWLGIANSANSIDLNYSAYLPVFTENGYNNIHSFEGDYALEMKSKANDITHSSTVYLKNPVTVPANANHLYLQFQYTRPAVYSPMYLNISVTINGVVNYFQFANTGDNSKWPGYYLGASLNYAVNPGDIVQCSITASGTVDNSLYLDNLSLRFVNNAQVLSSNTLDNLKNNPLYLGKYYSSRTFKRTNSELESAYSYYTLGTSPGNPANRYIKPNRITDVHRGSARVVVNTSYNNDGLLSSVLKTKYIRRTDNNAKKDTVFQKTDLTYVYEQYPDLGIEGKNILTPIAATVISTSTNYGNTWEISDAEYDHWTKWNSNGLPDAAGRTWAPWKSFILKKQISVSQMAGILNNFKNNPAYIPPANDWKTLENITARFPKTFDETSFIDPDALITNNTYSNGMSTENGHAKQTYTPVASFYNDDSNRSLYFGFEQYESDTSTINNYNFSSSYAFTGKRSKSNGFGTTFKYNNAGNPGKKYLIGFWALSQDSTTYFDIQILDSAYTQVYSGQTQTFTPGSWEYVEKIITLPVNLNQVQIKLLPRGTNINNLFLDDVRIGSADAQMQATIYDPDNNNITAEIDNNGNVKRYVYDEFNNQIAEIGNNNKPKSIRLFNAKRRKEINHSIQSPFSSKINMDIQGGGVYCNFKDFNQNNLWVINFPNGQQHGDVASRISNGESKIFLNKNSTYTYQPGANHVFMNAGISFTVNLGRFTNKSTGLNNASFIIKAQNRSIGALPRIANGRYLIDYYVSIDGTNYTITDTVQNLTNNIQQWCITYTRNSLNWYINGELIQALTNITFSNNYPPVLSTNYDGSNIIWLKDIIIFFAPARQTAYTDAEGDTVQYQQLANERIVTQQTIYDEMNRPVMQTMPVMSDGTFGYINDFITSYSKHTGKMKGQVEHAADNIDKASDDDKYYMYDQTVYEDSPFDNQVEEYRAGAYYSAMGPMYENSQQGNLSKAVNWLYYHKDQIGETIQVLGYAADIIDVVVNPEDPMAWVSIALDAENVVQDYYVKHHNSDNPDTTPPDVTSYYYDKNGQLIRIKLPGNSQSISYSYDFPGNVIKMTAPESGVTRNAYDESYRLRFTQVSGKGDTVIYFKYNKVNELIEKGYFLYNWTDGEQEELESLANNPDYPWPENSHILISWQYGDDQNSQASRNRIYSAYTRNLNSGNNITEKYIYDNEGNVLSKTTYFTLLPDSFTVSYKYNNLGKVIDIIYPSYGNITPLNLQYVHNDAGQLYNIRIPSSQNFAQYFYNADGSISYKELYYTNNLGINSLRKYTAPGYLSTLEYYNFFKNSYNYNFSGWFDNLRENPQYGDYVASLQYDPLYPGSGSTLKTRFGYDKNGNLAYFNKDYSGSGSNEYNLSYDKNNNYIKAFDTEASYGVRFMDSTFLDTRLNQPKYNLKINIPAAIDPAPWAQDTTNIDFYSNGYVQKIYNRNNSGATYDHKHRTFNYSPDNLTNYINVIDSTKDGTNGHWSFSENRVFFDYQSYGERQQKKTEKYLNGVYSGEIIKQYIHGVEDMPLAEIVQEKNAQNVVTRKELRYYVYDDEGVIAMISHNLLSGAESSYLVLTDEQGSVIQLVNRNGSSNQPVSEYSYDSYGSLDFFGVNNPDAFDYRYTGQEYDSETGLYNYKVRFYDPSLKYFLSPDPEMQNPATPFAYSGNNPVNYVDATGAAYTTRSGRLVRKPEQLINEVVIKQLAFERRQGNLRLKYMGATPGKKSRTGIAVLDRTRKRDLTKIRKLGKAPDDGLARAKWVGSGRPNLKDLDNWRVYVEAPLNPGPFTKGDPTIWKWVKIDSDIHMGHIVPVVSKWNDKFRYIKNADLRKYKTRRWMNKEKIYELENGVLNSSKGSGGERYKAPAR